MTQSDINRTIVAGWTEKAIHDAIAIVVRATFRHRLVAGTVFHTHLPGNPQAHARNRIDKDYFELFAFKAAR